MTLKFEVGKISVTMSVGYKNQILHSLIASIVIALGKFIVKFCQDNFLKLCGILTSKSNLIVGWILMIRSAVCKSPYMYVTFFGSSFIVIIYLYIHVVKIGKINFNFQM